MAAAIGATAREVYFTSGGTEADNLAVLGRWRATRGAIALSAVEHSAVREATAIGAREGATVLTLAVDEDGRLDLGALEEALEEGPSLVSVMWGNNETGTLQPVTEVAVLCMERSVPFHTDAVQAVGHVPVRMNRTPCSLLSLSAHKLGGPPGVGALFVRDGVKIEPLLGGGGQERGLRAGTSNVAGATGLAVALDLAVRDLETERSRLAGLRSRLAKTLIDAVPDLRVNGGGAERLPHILNLGLDGVAADVLVASLDLAGLAVSTGSACHSGAAEPSHVLMAMGATADAVIRFSFGWTTTSAEVDRGATAFLEVLERTRATVA